MISLDASQIKILIIDDDALIRLSIKNIVEKKGYLALEAGNGREGLAIFKKEQPHLIITDLLMPDKEGLETIKDIRLVNRDIKIIAMSSGGSTQNMTFLHIAEMMGANLAMIKPIRPDELLNAVSSLLAA